MSQVDDIEVKVAARLIQHRHTPSQTMSATTDQALALGRYGSAHSPEDVRVVDTDVHERPPLTAVVPYLEPVWQRYITDWKWQGFADSSPFVRPRKREKLDYSAKDMLRDLVVGQGVNVAILNNTAMYANQALGWYEFADALAAAYNDYQIDQWLNTAPWLRGSVYVSFRDPLVAAREIDRVGAHPQMVQVILPMISEFQYGDPRYRPIYDAAVRHNLVLALHHSKATRTVLGYGRYFIEWHSALPHTLMCQLSSFIFNGTLDAYPTLKIIGLEAGFTWLPSWMSRLDRQFLEFHSEVPWVRRKPSDYLRDNVRLSIQPMEILTAKQFLTLIDMMGTDEVLMFASDYPHPDEDRVDEALPAGIPDDLRHKIMAGNALSTYARL